MKKRILLVVAVVIVATGWFGNKIMHNVGLRDTNDIVTGMSFDAYLEKIPDDEHLDFCNYSFFVNNYNYPVLIRCEEDKIVQVQVIDLSKTKTSQERFEEITVGMSLLDVSRRVGTPLGIAKDDDMTLVYNSRNETLYLIQFTLTDNVLYVQSITSKSAQ